MCNDRTLLDTQNYLARNKKIALNRRNFTLLASGGLGAGILAACGSEIQDGASDIESAAQNSPPLLKATELTSQMIDISTQDGVANCYFTHPKTGRYAAIIIWPDIMSLRPVFKKMADRLAKLGYSVMVINPYYRQIRDEVLASGEQFSDPKVRARIFPYARALSARTTKIDARAMVKFLDAHSHVDSHKKIGTLGYCMGGSMGFITAADIPKRIGAVASFHGGRLVVEDENSPHKIIKNAKAGFLVAIADNDDADDPDVKNQLKTAFDAYELPAEINVYAGAMHGWCVPSSRAYHQGQAERAWTRLLHLLENHLA